MPEKTSQGKRTPDQWRADHAWKVVQELVRTHVQVKENGRRVVDDVAKKFDIHAKKLPTRIMASGLGQALAFLHAKKYAPDVLTAIADWVLDKRAHPESQTARPAEDALLKAIVQGNSDFLRRATDEALAYLQWLNRFAEAEDLTQGETGDR